VDPTQLAAQIVIGVGLLGAGAIIRARFTTQGLTTAASIWITAAIGISVGIGTYLLSFVVTIFVVLIFLVLNYISSFLESQDQLHAYMISTEERALVLIEVKKIIRELGLKYTDARMRKMEGGYEIEIALHTSKTKNQEFVERVMQLSGVKEIASEHL
jgi:putative Mg2+ transporter-C (MgtC) family protein